MAINADDNSNTGRAEGGWPFVNYAQRERNLLTHTRPIYIPRFKYTFLVEFQLSSRALVDSVTNIGEFIRDGKIYTHLTRIDRPRPNLTTETLRSYNKYIKVPTKTEFQPASMTFHDDSASIITSLWKEYLNFYSHAGSIGEDVGAGEISNLSSTNASNSFQLSQVLTGEDVRSQMETRPSVGLKLKPNDKRVFFESIVLYDLGSEPNAVNVYWFHHPFITAWDHNNLDKEDRIGSSEVTATFEYENYYFVVGQNRDRIRNFMELVLDFVPSPSTENQLQVLGTATQKQSRKTGADPVQSASTTPTDQTGEAVELGGDNPSPEELAARNRFPTELQQQEAAGAPDLQEPLTPSQLEPTIPDDIRGLQEDLDEVQDQRVEATQAAQAGDEQAARRARQLIQREDEIRAAIRQKQIEAIREQQAASESERSALENTRNLFDAALASAQRAIRNPAHEQRQQNTQAGIGRLSNEISTLEAQNETLRQEIDQLSRSGAKLSEVRARQAKIASNNQEIQKREDAITQLERLV